ncbi:F-actin-capping protein [Rhizophlyctis rosea]|nr:F-actin-capping protein [Rhizophlyctis rosea]
MLQAVIAQEGEIDEGHYLDPKSKQIFAFDHIRQTASDPEPYNQETEAKAQRAALEDAGQKYIDDHYPAGVISVFDNAGVLTIAIVDNKYNPNNFWNGRWRSIWKVTSGSGEVKGTVRLNVHYYEDGNVQLNANKDIILTVPSSQDNATAIFKQIAKAEGEFQTSLNESYAQLSETTFKSLRRALPVTRNKIDWHAISSYKIGAELLTK